MSFPPVDGVAMLVGVKLTRAVPCHACLLDEADRRSFHAFPPSPPILSRGMRSSSASTVDRDSANVVP